MLSAILSIQAFAVSGGKIVNESSCYVQYSGNSGFGVESVYPNEIPVGGYGEFEFKYPTGFFSSHKLDLRFNIFCKVAGEDESEVAGMLVVRNYDDDKIAVAAVVVSPKVRIYPQQYMSSNVSYGQLVTSDGHGFTLKLKNR